jgi:hypothetical protein
MLFTKAVTSALMKSDQEIVERTVFLAGLILSDWFESQKPWWCLNNFKGRKFDCVTICLAIYQLI